jgi:hypothetical protein
MKKIPKFKNESEEFEFWSSTGPGADSTKYIDWSHAKRVRFFNLRRALIHGEESANRLTVTKGSRSRAYDASALITR